MNLLYYIAPTALTIGCLIHAVVTQRYFPWIFVIFILPGVGPLIYLAVEVVPSMVGARGSTKIASGLRNAADPNRGFRQAQRAVEMTGSVDAKRALAEEHIARGRYQDAIALYEGALVGQFSEDPALLAGLARARFLAGDGAGAQGALDTLKRADPTFMTADENLLYARALELQGKDQDAVAAYRKVVPVFPGQEARARYGLLLQKLGRNDEARELFRDIVKSLDGAPGHYRRAQREWGNIARAALR
ncbi:MAG TPA: tetratricopeptide repeat protein [Rhizomicrobium sp.]|nr:tetratricopeptide repeat protein [Rhizomicrobium sp.]